MEGDDAVKFFDDFSRRFAVGGRLTIRAFWERGSGALIERCGCGGQATVPPLRDAAHKRRAPEKAASLRSG